jgi:hypothetical protein
MSNIQEVPQPRTLDKKRIEELVGRLRGTGGLPLKAAYSKSLISWLNLLAKRGYLHVNFLSNRDRCAVELRQSFPNSSSRSQFTHAILSYFYALRDDEFACEYPGLSRDDAVETVRAVAAAANKERTKERSKP